MQARFSFHCTQNVNVLSLCHSYLCSSNRMAAALPYQGLENPSTVWQHRTPKCLCQAICPTDHAKQSAGGQIPSPVTCTQH